MKITWIWTGGWMQQALAFMWNHADYHRGTYGIQLSRYWCVCGVRMLKGMKRSGNLVAVIVSELPCGGKMVLGVWILNVIRTSGGNLTAASDTTGLCCGGKKQPAVITVLLLELWEVELVHAVPSGNFSYNLLVVIITQSSAKLLVSHVCSAIPLTPQTSHLVGSFDRELPICSFPWNDRRVSRVRQNVQNKLEELSCFGDFAE